MYPAATHTAMACGMTEHRRAYFPPAISCSAWLDEPDKGREEGKKEIVRRCIRNGNNYMLLVIAVSSGGLYNYTFTFYLSVCLLFVMWSTLNFDSNYSSSFNTVVNQIKIKWYYFVYLGWNVIAYRSVKQLLLGVYPAVTCNQQLLYRQSNQQENNWPACRVNHNTFQSLALPSGHPSVAISKVRDPNTKPRLAALPLIWAVSAKCQYRADVHQVAYTHKITKPFGAWLFWRCSRYMPEFIPSKAMVSKLTEVSRIYKAVIIFHRL